MEIEILKVDLARPDFQKIKSAYKFVNFGLKLRSLPEPLLNLLRNQARIFALNILPFRDIAVVAGKTYLILGTAENLKKFCTYSLKIEPQTAYKKFFNLIQNALLNYQKDKFWLKCRNHQLRLAKRTRIMGILNVTPDSFSDGGVYFNKEAAIEHALQMEEEGADLIDIGAESTRPGASAVSPKEQLKRIADVVRILGKRLKIPISIDTADVVVARHCLDLGASIINDIFALRKDKGLGSLIARYKAAVVLMHMKGTPRIMQKNPEYKDLISEIINFLRKAKERALESGVNEKSIIIDPGLGFGKATEHNLEIINKLSCFKILGCPILIGPSRKSFIGNVLKLPVPEREFGTAASVVFSILNGAKIVRVHNVKRMREVIKIAEAIQNQNFNN